MSDFDKLRRELSHQGYAVEKNNKGHWKVTHPNLKASEAVVFSESNDYRALHNTLSDLRKIGFKWPPSNGKKNGTYEPPALTKCPLCAADTFNPSTGTCENIGGCASHAAVDTDSLYLEVKAAKELVHAAADELKKRQDEVERATLAFHEATQQHANLRNQHESLKKQLIKALEE